jgi:Flp pilus assembly protein TadG
MRVRGRFLRGERGQALVEFTLALPLLLLILFTIIDLATALNYWNDETNLANVAARFASVAGASTNPGTTGSTIPLCGSTAAASQTVSTYVNCVAAGDSGNLTGSNGVKACITDQTTSGAYNQGDAIQVQVSYTYTPIGFIHGLSIPISSSATMYLEDDASGQSWITGANSTGC